MLNKSKKFAIYCYTNKERLDIQHYLFDDGFDYITYQDSKTKLIPCVIFNFDYDGSNYCNYIIDDIKERFDDITSNMVYEKYNARDILLNNKLNKIKNKIYERRRNII